LLEKIGVDGGERLFMILLRRAAAVATVGAIKALAERSSSADRGAKGTS
jgi:hypothetical protein